MDVRHERKPLPRISYSVGISVFPDHGDILVDLLKITDTALYLMKVAGHDQVVVGQAISHDIKGGIHAASPN